MKILKKLLLINWHYFTHELLEFEQLNYMTGVNASGKSTIIDALQLVLLGDTSGRYFNKSASGKSARTLESYLCGEISNNAEGGFRYLREGRFTSYAVTEWYDDEKRRSLSFGGVFDVHSPGDRTVRFFKYTGKIPDNHFIESRVPLDIPKLREYFKQKNVKDARFFDSGVSYREEIYGLLGALRPKFKDLLKKAVAFNPDNNIQKFITEFVCDSEKGIDVAPMQANIRNYKNLEQTAAELERKKAALEAIETCFVEWGKNRESEKVYAYLIDRAKIQVTEEELKRLRQKEAEQAEKLLQIQDSLQAETERFQALRQQYEELNFQLRNDETERRLNEIGRRMAELRQIISRAQTEYDKLAAQFEQIRHHFTRDGNDLVARSRRVSAEELEATTAVHLESTLEVIETLKKLFEQTEDLPPEKVIKSAPNELTEIVR